MKIVRPLLVCLVLVSTSSLAADIQIRAAEITGYGIFESKKQHRIKGFEDSAPAADSVEGVRFINFTNKIPGVVGTGFGMQYVINSTPRGGKLRVTNVIRFPGEGLVLPTGRVYTESREDRDIRIGQRDFYGYAFDEAWEIVPGDWVFEVWHKKSRIIRKTFTVVAP